LRRMRRGGHSACSFRLPASSPSRRECETRHITPRAFAECDWVVLTAAPLRWHSRPDFPLPGIRHRPPVHENEKPPHESFSQGSWVGHIGQNCGYACGRSPFSRHASFDTFSTPAGSLGVIRLRMRTGTSSMERWALHPRQMSPR